MEVPPPGEEFTTEMLDQPIAARLAEGTVALMVVALSYVVASGAPFSSTVELLLKPVPMTVMTVSPDPDLIPEGEIDASVGERFHAAPETETVVVE